MTDHLERHEFVCAAPGEVLKPGMSFMAAQIRLFTVAAHTIDAHVRLV